MSQQEFVDELKELVRLVELEPVSDKTLIDEVQDLLDRFLDSPVSK